jgi:type II secretory ATPase GspE/PulE/Tfp pilus assembly ATPase PilB-like protein
MPRKLDCEKARALMAGYLRDDLSDEERRQLEDHLSFCPHCPEELEGAKRVLVIAEEAGGPAVVQLVDEVFKAAIEQRASDIHAEPSGEEMLIRLRVDGVMREYGRYPLARLDPYCARVKYLAEGDFAAAQELTQPWGGRIEGTITTDEPRKYDMRCSYLPAARGPSMVIRILSPLVYLPPLENVGLGDDDLACVRDLLAMPNGIIIITGPTGHGRTTLAYAMLGALEPEKHKVITIESPVEVLLPNVIQMREKPKEGLTQTVLLRHIMRQDPDVIFCGEIPDLATAESLMAAALTGHLVITIMSSPEAVSAVARLAQVVREADLDLVAETVRGVIGIRLMRRVCENCAEQYAPSASELAILSRALGRDIAEATQLRRGRGCDTCRATGYRGRVGIFEVLRVDKELAELIRGGADSDEIIEHATKAGFTPLRADAARKILDGLTTIDEMRRTVQSAT